MQSLTFVRRLNGPSSIVRSWWILEQLLPLVVLTVPRVRQPCRTHSGPILRTCAWCRLRLIIFLWVIWVSQCLFYVLKFRTLIKLLCKWVRVRLGVLLLRWWKNRSQLMVSPRTNRNNRLISVRLPLLLAARFRCWCTRLRQRVRNSGRHRSRALCRVLMSTNGARVRVKVSRPYRLTGIRPSNEQ